MKTFFDSLNRIFKAPLLKTLFIVLMFFSFAFWGTINNEKVIAGDCANYETTYSSPSGGSYSGGVFTITNESQAVMYVHLESKSGVLFHLYVYVDDVLVLDKGSEYTFAWNMYCNNFPRIYIGSSITSKSIGYLDHEDYFYTDVKLPYSLVKHGSVVKVKAEINLGGYKTFSFTVKDGKGPSAPSVSNPNANKWALPGYTISWSGASDSFSGLSKYQYTNIINGSNDGWKDLPSGGSDTWTAERNNDVCFRGVDKAGNAGSQTCTRVKIDNTAPSSSLSITNSSGGNWTNADLTLKITGGADSGTYQSGFSKYQYSYDGSSWTDGSGWTKSGNTWTGTWSAERNTTVWFRVCDAVGKCSSTSSTTTTVKIDKTAPSKPTLTNTSNGNWTNTTVKITPSGGSDTGSVQSGFSTYKYSTSASGTYSSTSGTKSFTTEQNTTYYYKSCDVAGNCSSYASTGVKIDKTNPNGSISISNTSGGNWTNQSVTITVTGATDTAHASVNSGIKYYTYSYDNSDWADPSIFGSSSGEYNNSSGATDTWASEGDRKVYFRACDNAGNCTNYGESYTTLIRIDTTAPSGTFKIENSSGGNWTNQNVTVKAYGMKDPLSNGVSSGLSVYKWKDVSGWYSYGTYNFYTQSDIGNQASGYAMSMWDSDVYFTLQAIVCDNAGNCTSSASTTQLKIDKTAPSSSINLVNSSGGNWINSDVTVTISGGTDTGGAQSGFSKYQYSYDNSVWYEDWTTPGATTVGIWSAERDTIVYFRVCDAVGNCSSSSSSTTYIRIDRTAPSTYFSMTNSSGGNWTNQQVVITLSGATDLGTYKSGFNRFEYKEGSGSWKSDWEYPGITTKGDWEAQADMYVYFRVCDNAGNCSGQSDISTRIRIDLTAPSSSISIDNSSGENWTNQDVWITLSGGVDQGTYQSGFSKYQYRYDSTGWGEIGGTHNGNIWSDYWSAERNEVVYFRVCDVAGNCSAASSSTTLVKIDKTGPNGTINITNTSGGNWTNQSVTITVTGATDTAHASVNSGIKYYTYSYDNSDWADPSIFGSSSGEYNNSSGATDTWASEGDRKVYFRACDNAGNCTNYGESYTTLIRIDTTAPSGTFKIENSSGGNWTNQNVTVKAYGMKDPLSNGVSSGLSVYKWKDVSGWYSYGTYNFYTHSNINDQTNGYALVSWDSEINFTFQVVVCDNAGNCTNASSTTNIKIDKTAPGGTMSISNTSGGNWTNQPVTITASGIVEQGQSYLQSGMRHYRYSYDGTNWYYENFGTGTGEYNNSNGVIDTWAADRDSTVYIVGCDNAGNCSSYSSTLIRIDTVAPEGTLGIYNDSNGNWTNQNVFVQVGGASDPTVNGARSGIKQYDWSNGSGWNKFYTQYNVNSSSGYGNAIWSGETDFTLTPRVCDNAGNCLVGTTTTQIRIDKTKPSDSFYIGNNSGGNWVNTSVQINLSGATDLGTYQSGIRHFRYRYDTGTTWYYDWTLDYGASAAGVWWADRDNYIYIIACDNAGNCTDESESRKTRIRIDTVSPTAIVSVDKTKKTAIINFTDNISIDNNNAKIGKNYSYFMSENSNVNVTTIGNSWITPSGTKGVGYDEVMHVSHKGYYIYVKVPNSYADHVGNNISKSSNAYSTAISGYTVFREYIEIGKDETSNSTSTIAPSDINNKLATSSNSDKVQITLIDRMLVVTFDSEDTSNLSFDIAGINTYLANAGYKILALNDNFSYNFEASYVYHNVLVTENKSSSVKNEILDLVILINAPTVKTGNASTSVVGQGDELGNIAVAFTSDIPFTVDTQITLNGELVKKVDTNRPGVYEMRYIAKDEMGRVNKVYRSIVVNENKENIVVEEIKEEIEVKETLEVSVLPVEVKVETSSSRKVVENVQVEMIIENKEEVKSYKKKERKNKAKKDIKGTFKLFSKWFFKVYDG